MSEVTIANYDRKLPSYRSQRTLPSFRRARMRPLMAVVQRYIDPLIHPISEITKGKYPQTCRQWYYSLHYFLYLKKYSTFRNHQSSAKLTSPAASVSDEMDCGVPSTYRIVLSIISSLASNCWKSLWNSAYLGICFVGPAASNFILWILFGCTITDLQCSSEQILSKIELTPNQSYTSALSCSSICTNKEQLTLYNQDSYVENTCTYLSTETVNSNPDNITIEFVTLSKKPDNRSIESILQFEMSLPSPWRDIPYLFTSNMLKLLDDMFFNMNDISGRIGLYLYQELEPIMTVMIEQDIERWIHARICSNINNLFFLTFNCNKGRKVTRLIKDFVSRNFQNNMGASASSGTSLQSINCPQNGYGSRWELEKNICNTQHSYNYEYPSKSAIFSKDERRIARSRLKKPYKKRTSVSCCSHFNSYNLDASYSILPALRQAKSCIRITCHENAKPLSCRRLSEIKPRLFKNINTAITLAEGKVSKPRNPSKQSYGCNLLNETGCMSTKHTD